jgi:hypothetical protein
MAQQSFLWTALPNGFTPDGTGLRVSVLLSPRLEPQNLTPRLSSFFPDWKDWPTTLSKAKFTISYGGASVAIEATQTAGANRVDDSLGLPDSRCWQALFLDTLPVNSYQYKDLSNNGVLSYDTTAVASLVQGLYSNLARNADGNMPLVSDIADDSGWTAVVGAVRQIDRHFVNRETGLRDPRFQFAWFFDGGGQIGTKGAARMAQVLGLFQLFHTPPATPKPVNHRRRDDPRISAGWLEYERAQLPDSKDIAKKFDFHQMISTMNSYPTLLRRLGLVVDFIVDSSAFRPSPDQLLSAAADFPPGALSVTSSRQASPATHTILAADKFQAVSNPLPQATDHRVADGLLELDPNRFDVIQMDVDGAGLKVMNFARSLARYHPTGPDADSDDLLVPRVDTVTRFEKELGAPALRTAGMMLVQKSRWSMLKDRFVVNQARNAAAEDVFQNQPNAKPPELWAEDIVRGYRVDVWDRTTDKWRSLCQRTATYVLGDDVEVNPDNWEETTVRLAATKSSDPASNQNLLYLHEALVSWAGWSLAVPIPGRAVDPKDGVDKTQAETSAELPPGIKFKSKFNALPLSLPRLRFGRSYWMRARVVDLAGNSLAPQEKSFGPENPAKYARTFLRYEPVAAPIVALVRPKGGKTEPPAEGESIARMAIRSFNDKPADNTKATKQVARRFAVPPQSSARDAEQHGKLDASGKVNDATFNLLANLKDLDAKDPNAALCEEILPMKGPLDQHPVKTVFATYREGQSLTYLPDPLAEEVAVRIFDHPNFKDTDNITIPLYPNGAWPEARPFKIKVFEDATAKPSFVTTEWTLMVPLPKAIRAKVRLSMKLSDAVLDMLGVFQWLTAAEQGKLRRMARDGQHWMLSPWRTIEVVHAVQRPLITPEIAPIKVARNMFATSAIPQLKATCSLKSTDRLDLLAEWHEPQDDPDSDEKQADRTRRDVAFTVKITDEKSYARRVNHTLGGFAEHSIEADDVIGINVATERQRLAPKAHEFHDTRYRRISYRFDATTKFREFLPNKILTDGGPDPTDANIKASGPAVVTWVPSSAPPPAPKVLYVVPTYGWQRSADGKLKSSWRRGGGLRVYLDRPWNASGYGEMLAVVLPPAGFTGNPESEPAAAPYKRSITQWGNDPIWVSPFVSGIAPKRANFPLARTAPDTSGAWLPEGAPADEKDQMPGNFAVTGLTVPGDGFAAPPVEVAPHDVFYSPERRLWYCDIEIDQHATYYPFIRLALARYQPTSITGAHLSHVVLADFMTLASDRWLSVTRTNAKSCHVSVYGNRYSDSSGHAEASRARPMSVIDPLTRRAVSLTPATVSATTVVEVWLERLDEAEGEDFGWKCVADLSVQPSPRLARRTRKLSQRQKQRAKTLVTARNFNTLLKENLVDQVFVLQPIWDGDITLPAAPGRGNRYRLVIAEYEEYIVDDQLPYDRVPTKKDRRLVFVEHVELS